MAAVPVTSAVCLAALLGLGACGTPARPAPPAPPAPAPAASETAPKAAAPAAQVAPAPAVPAVPELPGALLWMRRSAEYRALTRQAYAMAAAHLADTVPALDGRPWGVILDADETLLDNSEYERRRAMVDSAYSAASWAVWVREEAAPAVPGAVAFTRRVKAMGGHVVVVTNRADALCDPTRANLAQVGVPADLVLCQRPGRSDKNPRFRSVEDGTASAELPALSIVAWVGDNIQDFPGLTQAARHDPSALASFGHTFFVLPNPVYGSWQANKAP